MNMKMIETLKKNRYKLTVRTTVGTLEREVFAECEHEAIARNLPLFREFNIQLITVSFMEEVLAV